MGSLLGVAALLVAIALFARTWRGRLVERRQPGRHAEQPICITDYREMDAAIAVQTCRCGGHYEVRGEGPGPIQSQRVARLQCRRCDREALLHFDVSHVTH
jgi:hypothetical protein